ncbi:MAG: lysophospholipid acyltransferase family protein [Desulfonatronovibrio sp.]
MSANNTQSWSSRSIASRWQHQFFYVAIHLGGRRLAYAFIYPVVLYYMLFRPALRHRTRHYLERRFPGHSGIKAFTDSFHLSLSFAKALVDRATVGIAGPESMKVRFDSVEKIQELLKQGQGLILMNAHVGCWQVAMSSIHKLDRPVNLLMKREQGDVDRHFHEHRGLSSPYRIIDPESFLGGAVEIVQALQRGEIVSVMGDRIFGHDKNTVKAPFLGKTAVFPAGAYKIAAITGAPVAVMFSRKTGPDSYALELAKVIRVEPMQNRSLENLKPYVFEFAEVLEEYVRKHPYQFYNFHDMWGN